MAIASGSDIVASDFGVSGGAASKDLSLAGATVIAHGLGKAPKIVRIMAMLASGGSQTDEYHAYAIYVGGAQASVSSYIRDNVSGSGSSDLTQTFKIAGITGAITVDATNITITWSGTSSGTVYLVWDAALGA